MIAKSAVDPENCVRQARFFPSARRAWRACLQGLEPRRILLPAYIGYTDREGSGVFDPVTELDIPFSFYPVGLELFVESDVIASCLEQDSDIDAVLLIHYFGWPGGNVAAIRSVCDSMGVILVEDCAHAFQWGQTAPNLGITGDYAFYSVHKYLASETGGILQVNNRSYPSTMEPRSESIKPEVLDLLARADLDSIARKRRENLAYLLQGIASIDGLRPMRNNIPLAPQSLPVWIDGDKFREKLYFRLIERSIPTTALYYRLHSFLKHEDYPDSFDVSDHILNLPIHQDMVLEQLDQLLDEIRFVLEELHA